MCKFFSGIIKPNHAGVWYDKDLDSHNDIMDKFSIRDTNKVGKADFVKFEMTPKDGNVFNWDRANWDFRVDQDYIPDWFEKEKGCDQAWTELEKVFRYRFVVGDMKTNPSLSEGRWYVKNSAIKEIKNAVITVLDGGTVQDVRAGGTVQDVLDGGTVQYVLAGGTVQYVRAGGTVQDVRDGGTVQDVRAGGTVQDVRAGGTVQDVRAGGTVQDVLDGGTVQNVRDGGTVKNQTGGMVIYGKRICVVDKSYTIEYVEAAKA